MKSGKKLVRLSTQYSKTSTSWQLRMGPINPWPNNRGEFNLFILEYCKTLENELLKKYDFSFLDVTLVVLNIVLREVDFPIEEHTVIRKEDFLKFINEFHLKLINHSKDDLFKGIQFIGPEVEEL